MWLREAGYMEETKPAHQDKNGNWTLTAKQLKNVSHPHGLIFKYQIS
jgi:hypothetical protein